MRTSKIPMIGLIVAALVAVVAQAQPLERPNISASDNSYTRGRACYQGTCQSCSKCWLRRTTLSCYNCCERNGCNGTSLSWCQDFCDGTTQDPEVINRLNNRDAIGDFVDQIASVYLDAGESITLDDVRALDWCIAKGDEPDARMALALVLEAYDDDRIVTDQVDLLEEIIGELHHVTLFHMGDCGLRSTARSIAADRGILGLHNAGETMVLIIRQIAAEPEGKADDRLVRMMLLN